MLRQLANDFCNASPYSGASLKENFEVNVFYSLPYILEDLRDSFFKFYLAKIQFILAKLQ